MAFQVSIGYATDTGRRARNEDFVAAIAPDAATLAEKGLIAAVADGVSSAGAGGTAARCAVRGLLGDYLSTPATWDVSAALDRVLMSLNNWLWAHNLRNDDAAQMVTTLTAIVVRGRRFVVAHVGDSRAMLVRGGRAIQLTRAHARPVAMRTSLTRALGLDSQVLVDYSDGDLQIGDCFVLTTDGAHGHIADDELATIAAAPGSAQEIAERLLGIAVAARTEDNASALVLRVEGLAADQLDDIAHRVTRLPVPPRLRIGDMLDDYAVTHVLVDTQVHLLYQVRDVHTGVLLALKAVHPLRASDREELAALAYEDWISLQMQGPHFAERFVREDRQTRSYLVYRWYAGRTLEQRLTEDDRPLGVDETIDLARQVAQALGQLHRRGIVHRDIKPENLMLCSDDGQVRILDLGAAISGHEPDWMRDARAGTPAYMNPEQWKGAPPDAGSDLYALGVTLYRALTRRLPHGDIEPYQSARYLRDPLPIARARPEVPVWLDRLVARLIARDPRQRFETAEELLLALERGAARLLNAPTGTPLVARDPLTFWRIVAGFSLLLNALLVILLLMLPH